MQNMPSGKSALGLEPNVVAGLCYVGNLVCALGLILSIITVVTDKTNKLARFHAFQSIFLSVLGAILGTVCWVAIIVGIFIDAAIGNSVPFPIFTSLLGLVFSVIGLALLIGVIMAAIKAFSGNIFKLPIIGNFADKYSG